MLRKSFLLLILLFGSQLSFAQFYLRVGYNAGLCNPREINKLIYIHNQINEEYYVTGKKLPEIKTFGGIAIAIGTESDKNTGWELQWQNKHNIVKSHFEYQGETIERVLNVRTNMLNIGFYGGNKHLAAGGSLDIGNFKGMYKRAPKDSIRKADYKYLFQTNDVMGGGSFEKEKNPLMTTQIGLTLYTQISAGPLGARFFYQFQFMNMGIDDTDNGLLGADIQDSKNLEDHLNNFGVLVFLKIGGYRD